MSDHERGAYSPQTDAPLAFDARQSRGGGGGFPTTLIISLVILIVLVVAIVMFYRSGIRGANEGPASVGAPVAQIKTPAPPGSQPSDEAAGLQIYKTESAPSSTAPPPAPIFAAPPEQPRARPTTPIAAQPLPAAAGAAVQAKPPAAARAVPRKDEIGALLDKSAARPAKPVQLAANTPAKAPAAVAPAPRAMSAAMGPAGTSVQIGAYSSEDLAVKGWNGLATSFPADMSGKGQHFEPVTTAGGKTLYRATVTGFASHDAAMAFCAKLKTASHACIVK